MSDLISRQAAIDAVNKICDRCGEHKKYDGVMCGTCYLDGVADIIEDLSSVQPEQKVGKWIVMDDDRISGRCSVCGWEAHMYEDDVVGMDYCPNCGARMEEHDGIH